MTDTRAYEQLLTDAVAVLTEAARRRVTLGQGAEQEQVRPADFAEFVSMALAGAAANIGGIENILAGRPGSWEAGYVRDLLVSTLCEDERYLMEHRTEPLHVLINVERILGELGYSELDDDAEADMLSRESVIVGCSPGPGHEWPLTGEQQEGLDRLTALRDRLTALRERESAAYGQALAAALHRLVPEILPGLRVAVEVEVQLAWAPRDADAGWDWDSPEVRLLERAQMEILLPGSGIAPKDYPPGATIAETERQAGRLPLARLETQ